MMYDFPIEDFPIEDFPPIEDAPLRANLSIEASAGTGKTHTLEQIVCRLIEKHDLKIGQILLVTYTEKAAGELRQRIRDRLNLRLKEINHEEINIGEMNWNVAKKNILQALNQFNEANISTIHSFFRGCLEQFALETGLNINNIAVIDSNIQPLRELLLQEFERTDFNPQSQHLLKCAGLTISQSKQKFRLEQLLELCEERNLENFWTGYPDFHLCPGEQELEKWEQIRQEFIQRKGQAYHSIYQLARYEWSKIDFINRGSKKKLKNLPPSYIPVIASEFFAKLQNLLYPENQGNLNLDKNSKASEDSDILLSLWDRLWELLLERPLHPEKPQRFLDPYFDLLCCLHPKRLEQNNTKFLIENSCLDACEYYEQVLTVEQFFSSFSLCFQPDVSSLRSLFISKFLFQLRERITPKLTAQKFIHGIRSFSDMVDGLYQVLVLNKYGDMKTLLSNLRKQYRCVLIDEFQDTDPIQWQILFSIFGFDEDLPQDSSKKSNAGLCRSHNYIVVGDPKQSIYRFRGASIELHKMVQEGCDKRYRLGANYRSNSAVIGACNQLFSQMWDNSPVKFTQVEKGVKTGKEPPPFLQGPKYDSGGLCFLDCDTENKNKIQKTVLTTIELQVLRLLSNPEYQIAGRPVRPEDIAILMARKEDCIKIYQRLRARGIPAQYYEKRSIFLDQHAHSLQYFFLALCQPSQVEHIFDLLISPLFDLSPEEAQELLYSPILEPSTNSTITTAPQPVDSQKASAENNHFSEFTLSFIQQLIYWKEQIDRGLLLDVLQELFRYGIKLYHALKKMSQNTNSENVSPPRLELELDVYNRILSRPQKKNPYNTDDPDCPICPMDNDTAISQQEFPQQDNRESYNNLQQLVEILAGEQLRCGMDCRELSRFLARQIYRAETEPFHATNSPDYTQQDIHNGQVVNIMTIHASKGLEFPLVFVGIIGWKSRKTEKIILKNNIYKNQQKFCYKQTAYFPGWASKKIQESVAQEHYEELQRLFYVALTRASCKIYLPFFCFKDADIDDKSIPYIQLLKQSLGGNQIEQQQSENHLRTIVKALVQEEQSQQNKERYFSLQKPSQDLKSFPVALQNKISERAQNSSGKQVPNVSNPLLHRLREDQIGQRFPVINSFTSLQKSLQHSEENIQLQHEPPQEQGIYTTDAPGSLGSFQDKERDGVSITAPNISLEEYSKIYIDREDSLNWHELMLSPGTRLGNLLHNLLEQIDYQMIAQTDLVTLYENKEFFQQCSLQSRRYFPRNWVHQAYPALCRMIWHTLHYNLAQADTRHNGQKNDLRLCQLGKDQRWHELEFLLAIPKTCKIEARSFLLKESTKIQISKGFLKGFIDLLFLHEGKLYLLDWKSNIASLNPLFKDSIENREHLSEMLLQSLQQHYQSEALHNIMLKHHYPMQYLIYLAVVYQYLKLQFGNNFQYTQQFGGCYYLFLRGMEQEGCGVYFHKPDEALLIQILKATGLENNENLKKNRIVKNKYDS